ncbi:MAG: flavodoxin domain-containing protein [Desulfosalsimonadaceae bacterium]|nr:flavodoxin domain-containing protein [Desulfosalsimonadaceae bacterium]
MKPVEISKGIYNVGAIDWNIRDFHGYSTERGTSYNSFLIVDEKTVLIDTVKKGFEDQLIHNISHIIDPQKIDIMISNHTEMDHSGGLPRIMHAIGEQKPLFCSKMGLKNLSAHFTQPWHYHGVENGETLNIGSRTLTFLETRMLHWPDSMFTYCGEDGMLFSSDAFGQHYAGFEMFDDVVGHTIMAHAKKYFANILMLYAAKILKLVEQVQGMNLQIKTICPDHGVIWRKDPGKIIDAYVKWSRQIPEKKAIVVYDTMWHSTEKMANAIAEGIFQEGVSAKPIHIRSSHRSDIMTEVQDAKAIVVGSPTLNNGMFPTVSDVLTYMKGLKPQNKIGAAFGSYGWSGESVKLVQAELEAMKFQIITPSVRIQYVPDDAGLASCVAFGRQIGQAVNRKNDE